MCTYACTQTCVCVCVLIITITVGLWASIHAWEAHVGNLTVLIPILNEQPLFKIKISTEKIIGSRAVSRNNKTSSLVHFAPLNGDPFATAQ